MSKHLEAAFLSITAAEKELEENIKLVKQHAAMLNILDSIVECHENPYNVHGSHIDDFMNPVVMQHATNLIKTIKGESNV